MYRQEKASEGILKLHYYHYYNHKKKGQELKLNDINNKKNWDCDMKIIQIGFIFSLAD